jgi:hypothetical protein
MEDSKRDDPDAAAEDVEDLDLQPQDAEEVKGGSGGGKVVTNPTPVVNANP